MSTRTALTNPSTRTALPKSGSVRGASACDGAACGIAELKADLNKFLYENGNQTVASGLEKFEQKTGSKREYLSYGAAALVALYLLLGAGASVVCNVLIGAIYPASASLRAVRNQDSSQDTRLLTYWALFGSLLVLDSVLSELPGFYLLKALGLLALSLPQLHGSEIVFARALEPALARLDSLLKKAE